MADFPQSFDIMSPWTVGAPTFGSSNIEELLTKNGSTEVGTVGTLVLVAATENPMPSKLCNPKSGLKAYPWSLSSDSQ
jgi:hypothetical protein